MSDQRISERSVRETQNERRRQMFEHLADAFFKRWQPHEPHEAAQFSAEFFGLVRQIYLDAQEPLYQNLSGLLDKIAHPPVIYRPNPLEFPSGGGLT